PKSRFHQVYRQIPLPGQTNWQRFPHHGWDLREDGTIELPAIKIPAPNVVARMARFKGDLEFRMGAEDVPSAEPAHVNPVKPFFLDDHEVTESEYRAARGRLPLDLVEPRGDDFAVSRVSYDEALHCAEVMGKRLPTEAEYEFAATMGGK